MMGSQPLLSVARLLDSAKPKRRERDPLTAMRIGGTLLVLMVSGAAAAMYAALFVKGWPILLAGLTWGGFAALFYYRHAQ